MSTKTQIDIDAAAAATTDVETAPISHAKSNSGFRKGVYISSIVAAVGGFISGYDTGAVSGILTMPTFQDNFFTPDNLTYLQGLLLAFFLMTAALGAFFSGFFCGMCLHILLFKKNDCVSNTCESLRSIKSQVRYCTGIVPILHWKPVRSHWIQIRSLASRPSRCWFGRWSDDQVSDLAL